MKIKFKHALTTLLMTGLLGYGINWVINWVIRDQILPFHWERFNLIGLYGLALVLPALLIFWLIERKDHVGLGWKKFSFKDLKYPLLGVVLVFPVFLLGRILVPEFDSWFVQLQGIRTWTGLSFFLMSTFFFVFKEELIERFIQARLRLVYGSLITILTLAVHFSIFHYSVFYGDYNWSIIPSVFFSTLVLAALYERTRNIWLTIIFHLVFNSFSALQIFLHGQMYGPFETALWIVYGIAFVAFAVPAWRAFRPVIQKASTPKLGDWVFLLIIGIGLPLLLVLIS